MVWACTLLRGSASGDEFFERKTQEADRNIASIEQLVQDVEGMRADAASRGQALRVSCLDTQLRAARQNLAVARSIRGLWGAGEDDAEYRERSLGRIMRLQVYALVFQDDARNCANAVQVGKALEVTDSDASRSTETASVTELPPPQPRLERPPLASPF